MRMLVLLTALAGCADRALDVPGALPFNRIGPEPCCVAIDNAWYCKDDNCPELKAGTECTTLGVGDAGNYCQVETTDYCVAVYLEKTAHTTGHVAFQTVYCF